MISDVAVDLKLLRTVVDGHGSRAGVLHALRKLFGEALHSNSVSGVEITSLEDHTKSAMIEGRNGFEATAKDDVPLEVVLHASHFEEQDW